MDRIDDEHNSRKLLYHADVSKKLRAKPKPKGEIKINQVSNSASAVLSSFFKSVDSSQLKHRHTKKKKKKKKSAIKKIRIIHSAGITSIPDLLKNSQSVLKFINTSPFETLEISATSRVSFTILKVFDLASNCDSFFFFVK